MKIIWLALVCILSLGSPAFAGPVDRGTPCVSKAEWRVVSHTPSDKYTYRYQVNKYLGDTGTIDQEQTDAQYSKRIVVYVYRACGHTLANGMAVHYVKKDHGPWPWTVMTYPGPGVD